MREPTSAGQPRHMRMRDIACSCELAYADKRLTVLHTYTHPVMIMILILIIIIIIIIAIIIIIPFCAAWNQ